MLAFDAEDEEADRSSDRHVQFRREAACCKTVSGDGPVAFGGSPQCFRFSWIESFTKFHSARFGWRVTNWQSFVERLDSACQILVAEIDSLFDLVTDCGCHDRRLEYVDEKFDRVRTGVITSRGTSYLPIESTELIIYRGMGDSSTRRVTVPVATEDRNTDSSIIRRKSAGTGI